MKMGRVVFFMVMLAGLTLASASAQAIEKGTGELGIFERVSFFDPALNLRDWGGLGLRAGYFFHENLELEADLSRTATDGQFGDLRRVADRPQFGPHLGILQATGERRPGDDADEQHEAAEENERPAIRGG